MPFRDFKRAVQTKRWVLINMLGARCCKCKRRCNLEFHHIRGTNWDYRKVNQYTRILRFIEEAKQGLIHLLCGKCNKHEGRPMQWE